VIFRAYPPPSPPALRQQTLAEMERLVSELRQDADWLLLQWHLYRSRDALLTATQHGWRERSVDELWHLASPTVDIAEAFFQRLDRYRDWLRHTDAMPATLRERHDRTVDALTRILDEARPLLDPAPLGHQPVAL